MKLKKVILGLLIALVLCSTVVLAACDSQVTVTFVYGNGTDNVAQAIESGSAVSEPEKPTREGYDFGGWYADEACTQKWNFDSVITEDITLYAKWTADPTWRDDLTSVEKVLEIISGLESGKTTEERYYIRGTVTNLGAQYGSFDIVDGDKSVYVYGSYSADGKTKWSAMADADKPNEGDTVLIYGNLQNYKGKTPEIYSAWIIAVKAAEKEPVVLPAAGSELTIPEALNVASMLVGEEESPRYVIKGTVKTISNPKYGEMYLVDAEGNEIYVYGSYSADGETGYAQLEDKPLKGDDVTISAIIHVFKEKVELKSVWIQSVKHNTFDDSAYKAVSIKEARTVAQDAKIKVTGVVAAINQASGFIPSGVLLVDNEASIFIHDTDVAGRVEVGNTITVAGSKTWWITSSETSAAAKLGYKGSCQIEKAWLLSNDGKKTDYNTSWIPTATVKEILDTPVTTDISASIYKVTAVIKKVAGAGFVNYYFNDLDETTGSYAYTLCNGNDYAWLDKFDGKICSVYLCVLNAKSTSTGGLWRFLPVTVEEATGFQMAKDDITKFVVDYYAVDQFLASYAADPAKELVTKVSSQLLGFENVAISYASSNENVVYFKDGVLHTKDSGKATVTITASYTGAKSHSVDVEISVVNIDSYDCLDVAGAIAAEVKAEVTVRGIVGPKTTNKNGFYLIDNTGVISVIVANQDDLALFNIGDEVIIKGKRDAFNPTDTLPGQTCITSVTLEVNLYGKHEYAISNLITNKTWDELVAIAKAATVDHSTEVYQVQVKVKFDTQNVQLHNPAGEGDYIMIYASGVGQSNWMKDYDGQVVTVDFAFCNWNNKTTYKVCVLAIHLADGTVITQPLR